MEFEDLSEEMQWEARRVAAAFGGESFEMEFAGDVYGRGFCWDFASYLAKSRVKWSHDRFGHIWAVSVGNLEGNQYCLLICEHQKWTCIRLHFYGQSYEEPLARGLYCMGFEEAEALNKLNYPLSMHEKLELRLSMPREFWPPRWRGEAGEEPHQIK